MPFGFEAPSLGKKKSRGEELDELMAYLKGGGSLGAEIENRLDAMPGKYSVLLLAKQEKYGLLLMNVVKYFCKKKMSGIFVTLNKPGKDLVGLFNEHGVNCENLFIVDGISKRRDLLMESNERVSYIDTPKDLTDLESRILDFILKMNPGQKFFVLDSLSTLMIYNGERTVERFVHSLGEKLRAMGFKSVFIIMEGTRPEIMNVLSQFTDKVITASPEINP